MLGNAVSSSTPNDFQPNSHMGVLGSCPLMNLHASSGCPRACVAVGMQRALASAIGLPSRSTSASWMLVFLMPAEVRRSLMLPPGVITAAWWDPLHRQPSSHRRGLRRQVLVPAHRLRSYALTKPRDPFRGPSGGGADR